MRQKFFIGVVLSMGLAASGAWADMPTSPLTVGDKTFTNFTCTITYFHQEALPSACAQIAVLADTDSYGNLGIDFAGNFNAYNTALYGEGIVDILIGYTVTAPSALITDLHMVFNGAVTGLGATHVAETVNAGAGIIAQIDVGNPLLETGVVLNGGPYTFLNVRKDIELSAGTVLDGSATMSDIGQYFSQTTVPEPASILLFGTLLLGCGALLRKRA